MNLVFSLHLFSLMDEVFWNNMNQFDENLLDLFVRSLLATNLHANHECCMFSLKQATLHWMLASLLRSQQWKVETNRKHKEETKWIEQKNRNVVYLSCQNICSPRIYNEVTIETLKHWNLKLKYMRNEKPQ